MASSLEQLSGTLTRAFASTAASRGGSAAYAALPARCWKAKPSPRAAFGGRLVLHTQLEHQREAPCPSPNVARPQPRTCRKAPVVQAESLPDMALEGLLTLPSAVLLALSVVSGLLSALSDVLQGVVSDFSLRSSYESFVPAAPPETTNPHETEEKPASPDLPQKMLAEFLATFFVVFTACTSKVVPLLSNGSPNHTGAGIAAGLVVAAVVYSTVHISKAHFNPAVTFAMAYVNQFPWYEVPAYIAAQIAGSIAAVCTVSIIFARDAALGLTKPIGDPLQALAMEMILTFALLFFASALSTDDRAEESMGGFVLGGYIGAVSLFAGPISGGSMNPARSLGPAIVSGDYTHLWLYIVGPVLGAICGAVTYKFVGEH